MSPTQWQEGPQADAQRAAVRDLRPAPAAALAPDTLALSRSLTQHTATLTNLPFAPAPETSIRKSVALAPASGATEPNKCPLCADNFYTSGSLVEQLAWQAVHAIARAKKQGGGLPYPPWEGANVPVAQPLRQAGPPPPPPPAPSEAAATGRGQAKAAASPTVGPPLADTVRGGAGAASHGSIQAGPANAPVQASRGRDNRTFWPRSLCRIWRPLRTRWRHVP